MNPPIPPAATAQAVPVQAGNIGGVRRETAIKIYEKELRIAWWWACVIGSLYSCSQFVVFCNLTWATVALLGAFLPYLVRTDFNFVVCLLLLEAARLSSAAFFTRLLGHALAYLSQDPKLMNPSHDEQYDRARWARWSSPVLQLFLTIPGVVLSAIRVFSKLNEYDSVEAHNVQKSLRIFYCSVFSNCLVAIINLVCSALAACALTRKFPEERSILRYFDKVLGNAMSFGVVQADEFEFLQFAFTMLAGEFKRNVQPEAVAKNHKQLLHYLYAHRLGVDLVQTYLVAEDVFLQLVAANVVGFWAEKAWGTGVENLKLPEDLLMNLADKVGMAGQVGWAATSSFGAVALSSPDTVGKTRTSRGIRLLDRLAELVDVSSSRSLALVRTLVFVFEKSSYRPDMGDERRSELEVKLWKLAADAKLHRLRVQAAYLLRLMNPGAANAASACDDEQVILKIKPSTEKYWYKSEKRMLIVLRTAINASIDDVEFPEVRDDYNDIASNAALP